VRRRRVHHGAPSRAGRERALAQQIEFILVEAALQSEQQPVIAVARRIDRLLIDQHRVDHAAHLDQLLTIPAVAGESSDFTCADRANLAQAHLRHHTLEVGALDPARRRASQIVSSMTSISDEPSAVRRLCMAYRSALLSRGTATVTVLR
jgi:hypothetical protein